VVQLTGFAITNRTRAVLCYRVDSVEVVVVNCVECATAITRIHSRYVGPCPAASLPMASLVGADCCGPPKTSTTTTTTRTTAAVAITRSPLGSGPKTTKRSPIATARTWIVRFHSVRKAANPSGCPGSGRRHRSIVRTVQSRRPRARFEGPLTHATSPTMRASTRSAQVD
jgi:hypothetical protein